MTFLNSSKLVEVTSAYLQETDFLWGLLQLTQLERCLFPLYAWKLLQTRMCKDRAAPQIPYRLSWCTCTVCFMSNRGYLSGKYYCFCHYCCLCVHFSSVLCEWCFCSYSRIVLCACRCLSIGCYCVWLSVHKCVFCLSHLYCPLSLSNGVCCCTERTSVSLSDSVWGTLLHFS